MAIPNRPKLPTPTAHLQWLVTDDGSRTLWDERLNETYHSGCGAVAECWFVYLHNSGVLERLKLGQPTAVLEYGFGTATAFLVTAAVARLYKTPIFYRSLEWHLQPADIFGGLNLQQANGDHPGMEHFGEALPLALELQDRFVQWRSLLPDFPDANVYNFRPFDDCSLELRIGDAATYGRAQAADQVTSRSHSPELSDPFHAVYFDPFSPETSPELWSAEVLKTAFDSLLSGGRLTSYCVKGSIRRLLTEIGFDVRRTAGPIGGKREVLVAIHP